MIRHRQSVPKWRCSSQQGVLITQNCIQCFCEAAPIAEDAHVRGLQDRGIWVVVDGDDGARAEYTHHVVESPLDTQTQVEVGGYRVAGDADLLLAGQPALVYH